MTEFEEAKIHKVLRAAETTVIRKVLDLEIPFDIFMIGLATAYRDEVNERQMRRNEAEYRSDKLNRVETPDQQTQLLEIGKDEDRKILSHLAQLERPPRDNVSATFSKLTNLQRKRFIELLLDDGTLQPEYHVAAEETLKDLAQIVLIDPEAIKREIETELQTKEGFSVLVSIEFEKIPLAKLLTEVCDGRIWSFNNEYDSDAKANVYLVEIDAE